LAKEKRYERRNAMSETLELLENYKSQFQEGVEIWYNYRIMNPENRDLPKVGIAYAKIRGIDGNKLDLNNGHEAKWNGLRYEIEDLGAFVELRSAETLEKVFYPELV
jgi:NADPH-dependent 7-cyano-7-deazaguanine reductase QueF-like protein|tara:strand:- start:410 stop:730 length:321 start_codon:yes stop_codon:yes gene_type:complete